MDNVDKWGVVCIALILVITAYILGNADGQRQGYRQGRAEAICMYAETIDTAMKSNNQLDFELRKASQDLQKLVDKFTTPTAERVER